MTEIDSLSNTGSQPEVASQQQAAVKLPVDPRTFLIGVRSRASILVAFVLLSVLLGYVCSKKLGHKEFEASTVLLYKPPAGAGPESDGNDTPSLLTQMDMLKIPSNLEETRRRLKIAKPIEKLGAAIKVEVPINSSLLEISVTWDSAEQAAAIANTMRDVFLENQLRVQHAEAANKIRDLESRLAKVQGELHESEGNLKEFTIKNRVVDTDKEAGWYLQQLINTELVYEEAVGESRAADLQQENMGKIVEELKQKVRAEEEQVGTDPTALQKTAAEGSANEADIRGRIASLKVKEMEMKRAKLLAEEGIYSKKDYELAKASYESEKFAVYNNSPSAALLREMTLRELNVKLANISDRQKTAALKEAVEKVRNKLDSLPLVQREYMALLREVTIRAAERERIDQFLGLARRQNESGSFPFSVVNIAKPPILPLKSNKRLIFIAVTILVMGLGMFVVVLLELMDRRLHSFGDAKAKLKTEVLVGLQQEATDRDREANRDKLLILLSRLRLLGLGTGTRLMIVSPTSGEGATQIAERLAQANASLGGSSLMVDARFRMDDGSTCEKDRSHPVDAAQADDSSSHPNPDCRESLYHSDSLSLQADAISLPGLSNLVAGERPALEPTLQVGHRVRLLPVGTSLHAELLLSPRVGVVLDAVALSSDWVFVHVAPLLEHPDALFLASSIPYALLVASAEKTKASQIEGCVTRLCDAGVRVLGIVVTNIRPQYAEKKIV